MSEEQIKSTEELNQTPVETVEAEEKFAKSGKKSKKHIEEVKAEEERKARDNARRQVVAPTFKKRIFPRGLFLNNVSATVRSADARSIKAPSE